MTVPDQRLQTGMGDPVPDVLRIWLEPFRGAFTAPTWRLVLVLVMGALLAPGKRTVSACLRITGRAMAANYAFNQDDCLTSRQCGYFPDFLSSASGFSADPVCR